MGRRKTAAQLEADLKYAKAREAYKPPVREEGATSRRLPKVAYAYKPMSIAASQTAKKYKVQGSKESVQFFTLAALNLTEAAAEDSLPRGAKPAMVHATVADANPEVLRAKASGRPYMRYGKGKRGGGAQYNYSAPISIQSVAAIDDEVKAVFTAVKSKLGGAYGRVWFSPEYFILASGGE